jgi:MFS family permease
VGLGQALLQLGAVISPLVGASRIEHRVRILPNAIRVGSMMRLQILGLALAAWFLDGQALLAATMAFLFLLGVFTGMQRVAFQMVIAKVIPIDRRGRLQGWRNLTGGAIAAGLAYFAGHVLIERGVFGNGYAATFFLAFALTSLGLAALHLLVREPDAPSVRVPMRMRERIRQFPDLLADRGYAWFMAAQALAVAGRSAMPFYILFVADRLGAPLDGALIGLLSLAFLGADTAANLIWGHLGDWYGFRTTFLAAVGVWIAATLVLFGTHNLAVFIVSFLGLGAAASGCMMSIQTMVLEFGEREDTTMRLALATTVEGAISSAGPLIGGLIVYSLGYLPLLVLSAALLSASFLVLLLRVREPRSHKRA